MSSRSLSSSTLLLLSSALALFASGCMEGAYVEWAGEPGGDWDGAPSASESGGRSSDGSSASRPGGGTEAGTLTAGAWDDNLNFQHFEAFLTTAESGTEAGGLPGFTEEERDASYSLYGGDREARTQLDIALVIDTTGSMSDEISYLQTEFQAIASEVDRLYPGADARWALILYRDQTDDYVTRTFDFTDDESELRARLADQSAGGGGDYPEASHAALREAGALSWREDADTARLLFWVADAPHHTEQNAALTEAVRRARDLDVHIYPVASSGVDLRTEASMRASAQLTGGRYLFLTDDSGVGGSHLEPTVPCFFVTLLNDAIIRMVDIEMSGIYREPAPEEVIRTGGDPSDGACVLESGEEVIIF